MAVWKDGSDCMIRISFEHMHLPYSDFDEKCRIILHFKVEIVLILTIPLLLICKRKEIPNMALMYFYIAQFKF